MSPTIGIDVSHHQKIIDWHAVQTAGIAFAYIKASEGADFRDPSFATNWQGARIVGLPRGAYHFFSALTPGVAQAENFLNTVPSAIVPTLPPALDLELPSGDVLRERAEMLREIGAWLSVVETEMKRPAILYTTREFYQAYLEGSDLIEATTRIGEGGHGLWLRSIGSEPDFTSHWTIWQFDDNGRVDGIDGPVDINRLRDGISIETLMD